MFDFARNRLEYEMPSNVDHFIIESATLHEFMSNLLMVFDNVDDPIRRKRASLHSLEVSQKYLVDYIIEGK